MIISNKIIKEIEKDRKNYWGQFDDLKKRDYKNLSPTKWIVDQEPFREYGRAVNWVIKVMRYRKYSLNDIQVISRNDEIERVCGSRTKGVDMLFFPFELGYSCPICSPPVSHMDINNEFLSLRLTWSEYKNHMYCKKCNIDIPSFLCADVKTKKDVLYYEKFYLEMIQEIKQPFLKIIAAKSKAYQNLRNRLKQIREWTPITKEWCIHWTDRCSIDGSLECLAECFLYCPDCSKCENYNNAFCLNDGKLPCMHFQHVKYSNPLTNHFTCNSFFKGYCKPKKEFCRDISPEECPKKHEEKKEQVPPAKELHTHEYFSIEEEIKRRNFRYKLFLKDPDKDYCHNCHFWIKRSWEDGICHNEKSKANQEVTKKEDFCSKHKKKGVRAE